MKAELEGITPEERKQCDQSRPTLSTWSIDNGKRVSTKDKLDSVQRKKIENPNPYLNPSPRTNFKAKYNDWPTVIDHNAIPDHVIRNMREYNETQPTPALTHFLDTIHAQLQFDRDAHVSDSDIRCRKQRDHATDDDL
ncbi:hypothetical protein AC578_1197 [Pseudocercospora eumusae]|uniref:Uncharacterized protein n=1 Tax=Pseudocercospora eumusae TaxID=321146 RepID=A0A139H057_9PEZI|nr:hypothetical protein AC578_1197 [Pseudocercospora eumusae]